jgi:DNA methylase
MPETVTSLLGHNAPAQDNANPHLNGGWAAALARQGSVFVTGQVCSRDQRRGRYTKESFAHPGKMLPSIARYLIRTYSQMGELVCDPMAGIATTVVEAMHLGRHGIAVEYEARWAAMAADNIRLAIAQGAPGTATIIHGDSRHLPALVPPDLHGRIALVITSPPYGPSTHGHARTPGPRRGKVRKINHRYGDSDNLAYRDHDELADGFTQILTGVAAILRPDGIVAITARPYRRHGELVDIPGMVVAAGTNAGLRLHEECAALIAGVRHGRLVPRPSFFQQKNIRAAIAEGDPQWLVQHEDVLLFHRPDGPQDREATPVPPLRTSGTVSLRTGHSGHILAGRLGTDGGREASDG